MAMLQRALKSYIWEIDTDIQLDVPGAEKLWGDRDCAQKMLREVDEVLKVRM